MQTARTQYPVLAEVRYSDTGDTSVVQLPFNSISSAHEELRRIAEDVLHLHIDLSGRDIPAEDLACLFQLDFSKMTHLCIVADPPADDFEDLIRPWCTQQWPVEYSPITAIDPEDRFRLYDPPPFVYAHFLHGLNTWIALEHIELRFFLHVPSVDKDHLPAAELDVCDWVLAKHDNLRTVIVDDVPHRIQLLMGYLYIPVDVDVQLTTTNITRTFEIGMLEEMLPATQPVGARGARILDTAVHVHVEVGRNRLLVCGKLSWDERDKRQLVLEARPAPIRGTLDSQTTLGVYLSHVLRSVATVFDPSEVSFLRIVGDVTWISAKDWMNLMRPFRNVETLCMNDNSCGRYESIRAICEALADHTYDIPRGLEEPIFPHLRQLHITGVEFLQSDVDNLYQVLKIRKNRGRPVTRCLYKVHARGKVAVRQLKEAVKTLSTVVKDVELSTLMPQSNGAVKIVTYYPPDRAPRGRTKCKPTVVVRLLLPGASKQYSHCQCCR